MYDSRPKPEKHTKRPLGHHGEENPASRLTRAQVLFIRKQADRVTLRIRGERRGAWPRKYPPGFIRDLAHVYGVTKNTIYDILSRKSWRNV